MNIGAVILASGDARRFGSNKLLAPFRGETLLESTLRAIPPTLSPRVVVTRDAAVARLAEARGFTPLLHELPDVADSIRLGTQAMHGVCGALYAVADQPLLDQASVLRLIDAFLADPSRIVRASFADKPGNPVLFPARCLPALAGLRPGETGRNVLAAEAEPARLSPVYRAYELLDVDTPEDYRYIQRFEYE